MSKDRNIVGRVAALAFLVGVAYGIHRLSCVESRCPVMSHACCSKPSESPLPAARTK